MKEDYIKKNECFVVQKNFMEKLEEVRKEVSSIKVEITALPQKLIDKLDERYADIKTVNDIEDNIKWISRIVIGAVILALITLVIKN